MLVDFKTSKYSCTVNGVALRRSDIIQLITITAFFGCMIFVLYTITSVLMTHKNDGWEYSTAAWLLWLSYICDYVSKYLTLWKRILIYNKSILDFGRIAVFANHSLSRMRQGEIQKLSKEKKQ